MLLNELDNKTVLVTGGTGSIGSIVVRDLLRRGANVIVYSRDQNKQQKMSYDVSSKRVVYRNGDICDNQILFRIMKDVQMVVHCAAAKHVPICEWNPDSAIKTNVEGTRNVLVAAMQRGVKKCLLLSTDKAVYPSSVMGATKLLAERLFLEFNRFMPCAIVRLGNVFASSASVVPLFQDRIKNSLPLIVNDPSAERYFIKKKDAAAFIVDCLSEMQGGEIFIKKMKTLSILELANAIKPTVEYPLQVGHPFPGEKKTEALYSEEESLMMQETPEKFIIDGVKRLSPVSHSTEKFSTEEIYEMLKGEK